MAYVCPKDLDGFLPLLSKADTKFRQQVGQDLLSYLAEPSNSILCQDIGQFIDGLIPWMQSSNYKVSSNGIEVMTYLVDRLGHDFRPYLQTVLPAVVDRLGDAKDTVREKAQLLILKILEREVLTPQSLLDKLTPSFSHKNAKIREEVLRCLVNTLNEHGAQTVSLNKLIPHIVKLLSDSTVTVRDTAFSTMVDLYKHVGDKLRIDIQRRNLIPTAKLPVLLARFEEVKSAGELLPTAATNIDFFTDEVDKAVMAKPAVPVKKLGLGAVCRNPSSASARQAASSPAITSGTLSRMGSLRRVYSNCGSGAVDEESFLKLFEDVSPVQLFSQREVVDHMKGIAETISDVNKDWNKRVEALRKVRAIIIAGGTNFSEFHTYIKQMEHSLQDSCKDLRSQVVREACITIAYLAKTLTNKFERTAEYVLSTVINLIQNSAKIMATSGLTCVKFIIQYCQSPRLIPIITSNLATSKSKEIRRSCCEFLEQMLMQWPTHPLEKHIAILQDAVKKGIADADSDARVSSRKAFRGFKEHFPDQAEALLQSLEPSYRRALQGELCLSSSSSSGSLAQTGSAYKTSSRQQYRPPTTQSTTGSTENLFGGLQRAPSLPRSYRQRSGIPVLSNVGKRGVRSNSAIDLQAAQRAKARAQYAAIARNKVTSGTASLQGDGMHQARPRKSPEVTSLYSPERIGRTRSRSSSSVSHSQPTSRSASPSAKGYMYRSTDGDSPRPRRLSSGIPRSTTGSRDTSRETSPSRGSSISRYRRTNDRPPISPANRSVMAQKILQQSREAENALADALTLDQMDGNDHHRLNSPRKLLSLENHSDDSETSSVCSERSFDSYRRPRDDINEIISCCASTTWQERKEGLVSLRYYLTSGTLLSHGELLHITEIFTRMFMDSHTKGISVFLDTLNEIIRRHNTDLHDWLYVLLHRIFNKLGSDLLTSAHTKLLNTLDEIRSHFPIPLQLTSVYRFLVDATQTPNAKTKVAVLNYLSSLCRVMETSQFVTKPPANAALQKILIYSQDSKSVPIRNAATMCIIAMWNCNTSQVTMLLTELPKELQEIASNIVHNHMTRSTIKSEPGSPLVTPPRNDEFNQEEIYRSLRKTTAEIQNYTYETSGSQLDREKDTTSQDSGISQMSIGNDVKADVTLEEQASLSSSNSTIVNGYNNIDESNGEVLVQRVLEHCVVDKPTPIADKRVYLSKLAELIKNGETEHVILNFKKLLRLLIDNLERKDPQTQVIVLRTMTEIFNNPSMKPCWSNFVELLTLRVLTAHCDDRREVSKEAEVTAAAMSVFPFNLVVGVLTPLIQTSTYPKLQGAIKMLIKLIETHGNEITDEHLLQIMPGLVKTNDHEESTVRKSAVFCMVALHKAVGEERLAPHIAKLPGSKLKLLRLYIGRTQPSSSVPTSPKNSATTS
ncbi:CLIP-associating protein isoform X4 [Onthophagus taurus]|uniref:CLIP-associating protein isoform X4 n=1 Tax=Onthophagus taurus TaxID=166361 RepID=UPI0039BDF288